MTKSVERILTIWEDRSVYSGEFIRQLKNGLVWAEEPKKGQNCSKEMHSSSNKRNVGEFKGTVTPKKLCHLLITLVILQIRVPFCTKKEI